MKKLNKPVYLISRDTNLKDIDDMVKRGIPYFSKIVDPVYDKEGFSTAREINNLTKTRLNGGESLFFMSNSRFPRTKLTGTNFKRVIKPEKADVLVYKNLILLNSTWLVNLFETNNSYFAIPYNIRNRYLDDDDYTSDPEKYIKTYVQDIAQLNPTYLGQVTICTIDQNNNFLLESILDGTAKPLIHDDDLNKQICEGMSEITEEEVFSIKDMLESKDESIAGLGLKMLGSYNLNPYKVSLGLIIHRRYRILKRLNEWNCVSFKQVRNSTLNFNYSIGSMYYYRSMLKGSEGKDKELAIKILFGFFKDECLKSNIPNLQLIGKRLKFSICKV